MIPQEVLDAIEAVVASGREAIAKKERGKWVVLENNRRLVYKEPRHKLKFYIALIAIWLWAGLIRAELFACCKQLGLFFCVR